MTHAKHLKCVLCDSTYSTNKPIFECVCGGPLDVIYNYEEIKDYVSTPDFKRQEVTHWKYWPFFPVTNLDKRISMGEGGTPLLQSTWDKKLYFKVEGMNPTGSFKDRGSTIEITKAKEFKAKEVFCASTGNMGASIAAYSARADIKCTAFIPTFAPKGKVAQIKAVGTKVIPVKGSYELAVKKTLQLRAKRGVYLTGDYAYRGEGQKSVGFEIIDQLNWDVPDNIIVPVGNATLLSATFKAMVELKEVGLIKNLPNIIGVQSSNCAPLFNAWNSTAFKKYTGDKDIIRTIKNPKTIASAIACGHPVDGVKALNYLKTFGELVKVSDKEILKARKEIAREGIFVEPSGAVSVAGYNKLKLKGTSVCVLSGHGLKVLL